MIRRLIELGLLGLLLCGCGSATSRFDPQAVRATGIYGTQADRFSLTSSEGALTLSLAPLDDSGSFVALELPEGTSVTSESWSGDSATLHLLVDTGSVTHIGVVPAPGYAGQPLKVTLELGRSGKRTSAPPKSPQSNIVDLSVSDLGGGQARLQWTEVNRGDYNFDGEVNITDLTPLGSALHSVVDRSAPGANQQPEFWIDGDLNGLLTVADLTPIGANYFNQVGGYIVSRNGVRQGDLDQPYTLAAVAGQVRPRLPRLHSYSGFGSISDNWQVQTVDLAGEAGSDNSGSQLSLDLRLDVEIEGSEFLTMDGAGKAAASTDGDCIMRVVWPVEDIDRWDLPGLGQRAYSTLDQTTYSGLPRGVPLCADIIYVPAVDLATGQARSIGGAAAGTPYPQAYYVYTRVPFVLPPGSATLDLDAQIALTPNPAGGHFVELTAQHTLGGATTTRRSRLDFAASLLTVDSDGDGSYDDEPELSDSWRTNISDNLRVRYAAEAAYATRTDSVLRGTIAAIDEAAGTLTLDAAGEEQVLGSDWSVVGSIQIDFSEMTDFAQRTPGTGDSDIDDFNLAIDDVVEIAATRLNDSAQPISPRRFADSVIRIVGSAPDDTVYAVPELALAYPGQAVRVTVRTTPTASAFKSLSSLQITYPASCRYLPGSFNVGAPGGGAWDADGIWSDVGATQFNLPQSDFAEFSEGDRRALRIHIRPMDGTEQAGAAGDLFSFELIVGGDCELTFTRGSLALPLTAYTDGNQVSHLWTNDGNAGQPAIRMLGARPVLRILNPPQGGDGSAGNPYLITAPAVFQLALYSGGGSVTSSSGASFSASPPGVASVSANGVLYVNASYEGLIEVHGNYLGLPNTDESTLYFSSGPPEFEAQVDRVASFANGGVDAGTFSTVMSDLGDRVEVKILASGLLDLRALHFTLPFDHSKYSYTGYSGLEAIGEAVSPYSLLLPASGPTPVVIGDTATLRFGMAITKPGGAGGFSGGGSLITLHFDRVPPADTPSYVPHAYKPPQIAHSLTHGEVPGEIAWKYINQGDTDESGTVDYVDYNSIAKLFGRNNDPPFVEDKLEDIVDCNDDGQIDELDAQVVDANLDTMVDAYLIYGSDDSNDYSNGGGSEVMIVPWSEREPNGDDRTFFVFDTTGESPTYAYYWVVPLAGAQEGAKSNLLFVP